MTYYLISDQGVETVENDVTITARQATSMGNMVVNQNGKPVEPPIRTSDTWFGRFPNG